MAIEKMVAITLAGKIENFESVVGRYIYNKDIHLENAINVLQDQRRLSAFSDIDQYDTLIKSVSDILSLANISIDKELPESDIPVREMEEFLDEINNKIADIRVKKEAVTAEIAEREEAMKRLDVMKDIDMDISKLLKFEFIHFRFGHIPKGGYRTLHTYLEHLDVIFVKTAETQQEVWGFYFCPVSLQKSIDEIFNSLYFEPVVIPQGLSGSPKRMQAQIEALIYDLNKKSDYLEKEMQEILKSSTERLMQIYSTAKKYKQFSVIRKNAAHSSEFFYVVGWMSRKDAKQLEAEVDNDSEIVLLYTEEPEKLKRIIPPTKLRNFSLFKPFEMFVKMYGLPSYHEIDPTPILAVTYILFFGMMFGDVGQSAVLGIIGLILYKVKKWDLGGIIAAVSVSGIVFGFVYGSVFGNETLLESVRILNPMDSIWTLLLGTIAMGIVIICAGIIMNMINLWRSGNKGEMLFSHNGLAGMVFYVTLMLIAVAGVPSMLFETPPLFGIPMVPAVIVMVIALLLIYFAQPLALLVDGKKDKIKINGMFFVESFFELFEVLLSYFSNTISFLRIGAFAIVHAGMMMAVHVLSGDGGVTALVVQVLGNILVMVLEGLIVGIQVLRLEYYEMFSRYFSGTGKAFVSLKDNK